MSGLNHRQLFLTILEAEKPKIKVLTESGPSERFSFWLVDISFSIDPYMTEREGGREGRREGEKNSSHLSPTFCKTQFQSSGPFS